MVSFKWRFFVSTCLVLMFCLAAIGCGGNGDGVTTDNRGNYDDDSLDDDANDDDTSNDDTSDGLSCDVTHENWTVGLQSCDPKAYGGYTLFAPMGSQTTYLIDMKGRLVHTWDSAYRPGLAAYLLEDGRLLRAGAVGHATNREFTAGGAGGKVQLFSWDGDLEWDYTHSSSTFLSHHDVKMMPNGNILMISWELKSRDEAFAQGRDPDGWSKEDMWVDAIYEVQPTDLTSGATVWEWHAWDHLIQDYDSTKPNYGVVADHPDRIDLNYIPLDIEDWMHTNSVDYNQELDQIVISVHTFSEIWVIDHSATTAEAAGSTGGASGKGGDLLYRWGNPQVYGAGTSTDEFLYGQHDAHWVDSGLPGAGHIMIFNNGEGRPGGSFSSVDEIVTPVDGDGVYALTSGEAYGPDALYWTYQADNPSDFYSHNISGSQRLANGNTFICSGMNGRFFEVTDEGEIVWEYINPVTQLGIVAQGDAIPDDPQVGGMNDVFRAYRYTADYPGLAGRDLTPGDTIESAGTL